MPAATTTRRTAAPTEITIDNQAEYTVRFEITGCGRCGGTGFYGPMSINGGRCFSCVNGMRRTRRGEAAKQLFDQTMDELMLVPVLDLKVGDLAFLDHGWRKLTDATERPTHGIMTVGRVTTEWFREMRLAYKSNTPRFGAIIMGEHFKVRRYTAEARLAMLHRMCGVAGAFVELKAQPAA